MITAIIRSKENTLVLELPHSIYDIYEKLQSIGIMQPPKQIPLTDNEDEDIGVKLFSESDFGRHLLLTLNEKNSIADANKAYAESYKAKGFTFVWSDSLEFGWDVGWMGTPRISRDSVDGTIKTLKHHVDLIYKSGTDPANGVTADSVLYRVVQLEIDGGIAYAVIYG